MPINFQQVYARIREIAEGADDTKRTLEENVSWRATCTSRMRKNSISYSRRLRLQKRSIPTSAVRCRWMSLSPPPILPLLPSPI
jgi:hypothetical protein